MNAELYIWKLDAYSTGGVGLAFLIQLVLQQTSVSWICPYIDPVIAAVMAVILAKEPIVMIWDAVRSIILAAPKKESIEKIRSISGEILDRFGFQIDFLDVVKTGRKVWIDIYVTQENDLISISELKEAHDAIVSRLKDEYEDIVVELIPELDPLDAVSNHTHRHKADVLRHQNQLD